MALPRRAALFRFYPLRGYSCPEQAAVLDKFLAAA
jgi:hypothetical protein